MKKVLTSALILTATLTAFAQNAPTAPTPLQTTAASPGQYPLEFLFPIAFMSFLIVMVVTLVKYFLEFRLKSKLIEKGMANQFSDYLSAKDQREKQNEAVKLAILFGGIGLGLLLTYLSAPVDLHSIAMMSFSLGLSFWAYFIYLKKQNS